MDKPLLSADKIQLADIINDFRYNTKPTDMSPPNMKQEQLTIRNLAIIDLTNKIASEMAPEDREKFLERALARRGE
jgi:hypothetical protein